MPAIDNRAGMWPGWNELARSMAADSTEAFEQFAIQLWPFQSFSGVVERMLMQPKMTITEVMLDIILTFKLTTSNFPIFIKFLQDFLKMGSLDGVDQICQKLLHEKDQFDFSELNLELDSLFDFLSEHGYVDSFLELIGLICNQNSEFHEILQDEISALSRRHVECPHIVMLNMCLNAKSLDDVIRFYTDACRVVGDYEKTSAFLFQYFARKQFDPGRILCGTFQVAPVRSKVEKLVLSEGVRKLSEEEFIGMVRLWGRKVNGVCRRSDEMRKVYLLIKWRPESRNEILKAMGIEKSQLLPTSISSESLLKYSAKVFDSHDKGGSVPS
jgi:hypothetical protein